MNSSAADEADKAIDACIPEFIIQISRIRCIRAKTTGGMWGISLDADAARFTANMLGVKGLGMTLMVMRIVFQYHLLIGISYPENNKPMLKEEAVICEAY